jgi:hypothetical protein
MVGMGHFAFPVPPGRCRPLPPRPTTQPPIRPAGGRSWRAGPGCWRTGPPPGDLGRGGRRRPGRRPGRPGRWRAGPGGSSSASALPLPTSGRGVAERTAHTTRVPGACCWRSARASRLVAAECPGPHHRRAPAGVPATVAAQDVRQPIGDLGAGVGLAEGGRPRGAQRVGLGPGAGGVDHRPRLQVSQPPVAVADPDQKGELAAAGAADLVQVVAGDRHHRGPQANAAGQGGQGG